MDEREFEYHLFDRIAERNRPSNGYANSYAKLLRNELDHEMLEDHNSIAAKSKSKKKELMSDILHLIVGNQLGEPLIHQKSDNFLSTQSMKQHIKNMALKERKEMISKMLNSECGAKIASALKSKIEKLKSHYMHTYPKTPFHINRDNRKDEHENRLKEYIVEKLMIKIFFKPYSVKDLEAIRDKGDRQEVLR